MKQGRNIARVVSGKLETELFENFPRFEEIKWRKRGDASFIDLLKKLSTVTILFINLLISVIRKISKIFSLQIYIKLCNYLICQLEKIFFELYTIFWTLPNIRIYICREKNRVYLVKSKLAWTIISREWKTGREISAKCGLLSKLNEKREGRVRKLRHARARLLIQKEEEEEAGAADKRRLPRSEPLWPGYKRENPGPVCLRAGRGQAAARGNHVLPRARSPESFYCP